MGSSLYKRVKFSLLFFINLFTYSKDIVVVTACSNNYYKHLINFIGSLHKTNFDNLEKILVFDIGLQNSQKRFLSKLKKVELKQVDLVNKQICKNQKITKTGYKIGAYAWKPVVIKQALDEYENIFYMDSGTIVLNSLMHIWNYIKEHGFFAMVVHDHYLNECTTDRVKKFFNLDSDILNKHYLAAGHQGLSRKYYNNYVLPMYNLAKENFELFLDDGTCPKGFGAARHDQVLFSIFAYKNNMPIQPLGWMNLNIGDQIKRVHMHWNKKALNPQTVIWQSRTAGSAMTKFIKFK